MKILHIITSLKIGGAERFLCNLLEKLQQTDYEHHVVYFHTGPCVEILKKYTVQTYHISGFFYRYDPWLYQRLCTLVKNINPNIIHTSLWSATMCGRLLGKQYNIPVISDLHGNPLYEGKIRNFFDRCTIHLSNRIVAVSPSVGLVYKKTIIDKKKNAFLRENLTQRLTVICNGINATVLRTQAKNNPLSRSELGIPDNAFVIGSVGRFEPIKSYMVLLMAFNIFVKNNLKPKQPLILCLIGDGSQKKILESYATAMKIKQFVIFTGMRIDAYRFYSIFDCFALSSSSEGLSIALLEALCFGLPIITTHDTQNHDVITHGKHGLLVPPNQPKNFASAIDHLYKNPTIVQKMKPINQTLIDDYYHIDTTAKQYSYLFKDIVNNSN